MRPNILLAVTCLLAVAACSKENSSAPQRASVVSAAAGPEAAYQAGKVAELRGDYATALRLWQPLAEQGNAKGQNGIGVLYERGQGVRQDYVVATNWFSKAANQGLAEAQLNLGTMYDSGHGVPQNYGEAASWYRKAADRGLAQAAFNLGVMYDEGQGLALDRAEAALWCRRAVDLGDAEAQACLERLQRESENNPHRASAGTPQDEDVPRYDVDHMCELPARQWHWNGPLNPSTKNLCMADEQEAYDELKTLWYRFDVDLRTKCRRLADPFRRYQVLLGCIDEMEPIQNSRHARSFNY